MWTPRASLGLSEPLILAKARALAYSSSMYPPKKKLEENIVPESQAATYYFILFHAESAELSQ